MVSFKSFAVAIAAAFALTSPAVSATTEAEVSTLSVGTYYRPTGWIVSGKPGATTTFRRSPCPAINTLANHGFLPRTGKNITRQGLLEAVMTHFNLAIDLATFVTSLVPETFDLDLLGTHGLIEHDASLVHSDIYFGADPAFPSGTLLQDFFSRASSSKPYTIETMGKIRKDRLTACKQFNPNCTFSDRDAFLAFGEATFVIEIFGGDSATKTASLSNVRSFLASEKFPTGYTKPATALTVAGLSSTSALIQAAAV